MKYNIANADVAQSYDCKSQRSWGVYAIVLMVWLFSGNEGLLRLCGGRLSVLAIVFAILLGAAILKHCRFIIPAFPCLLVYGALEIAHGLSYNDWTTGAGLFGYLLLGYLTVVVVGSKLIPVFVDLMVFFSKISLFFFGLQLLGGLPFLTACFGGLTRWTGNEDFKIDLIFQSFYFADMRGMRNSGCMWEPGAWAGYMCFALLFLVLQNQHASIRKWRNPAFWLLAGIASTTSTTGYLAVFLIAGYYLMFEHKGQWRILTPIFLSVLVFGAIYSYQYFDFLGAKINEQYENIQINQLNWQQTRIGSLIDDYDFWKQSPIIGWGGNLEVRHQGFVEDYVQGKGNGFSDVLVKSGLIGLILLIGGLFLLFRRYWRLSAWASLWCLGIMLILLQGEVYMNYIFFPALVFLGWNLPQKKEAKNGQI